MKNLIYIFCLALVMPLVSCKDYLDTPAKSTIDESVLFSTPDLAQGAVDGIKFAFSETNAHRSRYTPYFGFNTDIEYHYKSLDGEFDDDGALSGYSATAQNGRMNQSNNAWAMMYQGIERANICIRGLRTYGDIENNDELARLLGESLTLRAIYYSDLLRAWGDVIPRFDPITSETIYVAKVSRDSIYKVIIADLEEAAKYVPWPKETSATATVETVNKAFIKGLRARMCMAASGYSQYPDGVRRSEDPELTVAKMYPIALQECLDVIDQEGFSVELEDEFETVFRKNCEDNINAGGESLWEIPWANSRGRYVSSFGVRHTSSDQYTGTGRGGSAGPNPQLFYDYDVKDKRRDVTIVPYRWAKAVDGFAPQELSDIETLYFGKLRYEWMTRQTTSSDDGINKNYMRYAEIILMAAELQNELNGPTAAAPYLKKIRQRAFDQADWSEKVDDYVNALTSKEAMFNAIVDEHAFEFCGEMLRKQTLIRWNLLKTKIDEAKQKMYDLRDRTGAYADVPEKLYYSLADDGETLEIYGLNRGETDDKSNEYDESTTWISAEELSDERIETMYFNDPDTKQFWPIWQVFIDSSNGTLTNDYGY
ncbi:RagB/SusD family nutrient uptake outer membrane protein [Mangrovibacterium marinum]|uniref:RagB/SusD family nutrient uptake outer membrane protein n=1 Tax=Mangrovibacterium marinum TaxID=1639118 RepID=UPI002A18B080|nr:RagB/SusD family nutrient uptake outer membrane protein [Mangrovibacterium marinum]